MPSDSNVPTVKPAWMSPIETRQRYHQRVCKKVKAMYPFCSNQQRTGWQAREKGAHRHERAKHRRG